MQSAKSAVSSFLGKSGHHDTTVHEEVNKAVVHETVKPTLHENVITAVDKEVHQDHHHTTVMPVHDREVLAEKHTHNTAAVQHREINHGNNNDVRERLQAEAAQFKNERSVVDTKHTQAQVPVQQGEHVHHHVHEHIQPVVHKETIQPEVVHTTVPIHEVHHNAAKHHAASVLPAMSLEEFRRNGGSLTGRDEKVDTFEGCPKLAVGQDGQHSSHQGHHHGTTGAMATGAGVGLAAAEAKSHNRADSGPKGIGRRRGSSSSFSSSDEEGLKKNRHSNKLKTGATAGALGTAAGHSTTGHNSNVGGLGSGATHGNTTHTTGTTNPLGHSNTHSSATSTKSKPSLMDKLNPKIDADGDGKAGFMS